MRSGQKTTTDSSRALITALRKLAKDTTLPASKRLKVCQLLLELDPPGLSPRGRPRKEMRVEDAPMFAEYLAGIEHEDDDPEPEPTLPKPEEK